MTALRTGTVNPGKKFSVLGRHLRNCRERRTPMMHWQALKDHLISLWFPSIFRLWVNFSMPDCKYSSHDVMKQKPQPRHNRRCSGKTVKAVQHAAVAGEDNAAVFDSRAALEHADREIANYGAKYANKA